MCLRRIKGKCFTALSHILKMWKFRKGIETNNNWFDEKEYNLNDQFIRNLEYQY